MLIDLLDLKFIVYPWSLQLTLLLLTNLLIGLIVDGFGVMIYQSTLVKRLKWFEE